MEALGRQNPVLAFAAGLNVNGILLWFMKQDLDVLRSHFTQGHFTETCSIIHEIPAT